MTDVYSLLTTPSTNKAFLNIFCNSVNANTMDIQTVNVNTLDSDSIESNVLLLNQSAVVGVPPVGYSALYADNTDRINVSSQTNPTQQIAYLSDIVGFNDNQIVSPDLQTKAECKDGDIFNVSLSSVDRLTLNNIKSKMSCGVSTLQLAAVSDALSEDTTTYMGASTGPSQNTISIYTPDQFQVIQNNGSIQRLVIDANTSKLSTKSILVGPQASSLTLNDDGTFSLGSFGANRGVIDGSATNLNIVGSGAQTSIELELPAKVTTSVFNGVARTSRHIIDQTTQTFYDSGNNERLKLDSNVTLHNLYQMPNTAGITGDTIIKSGIGSVWARPQVYGLFSATGTPVTVANTTVQTSIIPSGVGDGLTVPANYFTAGMSFLLKCGGTFSDAFNNTQITFRLTNSGVLFTTGLLTLTNVPNTQIAWNIETQFTYTGGSQIITNFTFNYNNGADARGFTSQQVNNTFNTSIINTLNFTTQWAIANPLNSISCNFFTLTKIF